MAKLEELEIGRPSTYASIIRTITARDYVFKKGSALVPTWLAFAVTRLLEEHFSELVDYAFTAQLEEQLDEIASALVSSVNLAHRMGYDSTGTTGTNFFDLKILTKLFSCVFFMARLSFFASFSVTPAM